ncbi:MAG: hypothetical protein HYW48_07135 [Deltaproteobacteria bacterium]|nr:hypothetical protein [Deltaproteobacteria bacterium]
MEETAQLVPPRNPGEATLHSPPQTPLSLFAPNALRVTPWFARVAMDCC